MDEGKKEIDFFFKFFSLALIESFVNQTNGYAARCIQEKADSLWEPTTIDEMMAFLGIHLVMSILGLPEYSLAWRSIYIPGKVLVLKNSVLCYIPG